MILKSKIFLQGIGFGMRTLKKDNNTLTKHLYIIHKGFYLNNKITWRMMETLELILNLVICLTLRQG